MNAGHVLSAAQGVCVEDIDIANTTSMLLNSPCRKLIGVPVVFGVLTATSWGREEVCRTQRFSMTRLPIFGPWKQCDIRVPRAQTSKPNGQPVTATWGGALVYPIALLWPCFGDVFYMSRRSMICVFCL